ncbi:hypothetical protein BC629DRAFT_1598249 [Irpex lacteus]|nr:hypothetical protein BC629DRAFT_1598249 [Irpex lacteus]
MECEKIDVALQRLSGGFERLAGDNNLEHARCALRVEKIQQARGRLEAILLNARSVHNRMALISRLPPELLGAIFETVEDVSSPASFQGRTAPYSWPAIQSVCRHWRNTTVQTHALWSYIRISGDRVTADGDFEHMENLLAICLSRSGKLPLSIIISGRNTYSVGDTPLSPTAVQSLAAHAPRIRYLCMHGFAVPSVLRYLTSENGALELESFVLDCPQDYRNRPSRLKFPSNWNSPRLRTLCINSTFVDWPQDSIHNLCHLVIRKYQFNTDALEDLHAVLSQNPRLEDLIFLQVHASSEDVELINPHIINDLWTIDMPSLRRISVDGFDAGQIVGQLIEKTLVLQPGFAKYYSYIKPSALPQLFSAPQQCFFPVDRLFIYGNQYVIGTDGHTSFCIGTEVAGFLKFYLTAAGSQCARVSELWLYEAPSAVASRYWLHPLQALGQVKKLVLHKGMLLWLERICYYTHFPALTEIQLHIDQEYPASLILGLLKPMKDARRSVPVRTLRIVLTSSSSAAVQTFAVFGEQAEELKQIIPEVVLEDARSTPVYMELPKICLERSSDHSFWKTWDTIMVACDTVK